MAREDIIINLLGQLYERRQKDPPSKNEQLQKILLANDAMTMDDSQIAITVTALSTLKWGGTGFAAGWHWGAGGGGQWK